MTTLMGKGAAVLLVVTKDPNTEVPTAKVPKSLLVGEMVTLPAARPLPVSDALTPVPMDRVAARDPVAVGAKLTATVQLAPAARLAPQVLLPSTKSSGLVPVKLGAVANAAALPFVTVKVMGL